MNRILKYGVLAGIATIVYFLLFYFYDKNLLFAPYVFWSSLVFPLAYMFLLGKKMMIEEKPFHEVLRSVFLVWLIADAMYYLWYFRLFNSDASLAQIQMQSMKAGYEYLMTQTQKMEEIRAFREALTDLDKNPLVFTFKDALYGLGRGLAGGFLLAYTMTFWLERKLR
jgi:uncharacterized membrane protein YhaH (DUF805 family)